MKQISMPVKTDSKINIKASGDLSIEGNDQNIMTAVVRHSDTLKISESGDKLELKATSDLRLQLPALQAVTVEKVGGDAR
jgi:predicted methyltransferase